MRENKGKETSNSIKKIVQKCTHAKYVYRKVHRHSLGVGENACTHTEYLIINGIVLLIQLENTLSEIFV